MEHSDWSIGLYLQTSNEAPMVSFTYGIRKFISTVNVLIFERKFSKFLFLNKFPMWKGPNISPKYVHIYDTYCLYVI